jgi:hypothetical protein
MTKRFIHPDLENDGEWGMGEVFAQRLVGEDELRLPLVRIAEIAFGRVYTNTLGAFVW